MPKKKRMVTAYPVTILISGAANCISLLMMCHFYNFPYTFGFLFSLGIYAEYLKNPNGFEDKYIALLRDTGSMKVEELAHETFRGRSDETGILGSGNQLMEKDAEEFIHLTNFTRSLLPQGTK